MTDLEFIQTYCAELNYLRSQLIPYGRVHAFNTQTGKIGDWLYFMEIYPNGVNTKTMQISVAEMRTKVLTSLGEIRKILSST